LIWPGEFLFGYPRNTGTLAWYKETGTHIDQNTNYVPTDYPEWVKDGNYIVYRRLRTLTGRFKQFCHQKAIEYNLSPDYIGALIFGRWPNGEPLIRSLGPDPPAFADQYGKNLLYRNNFAYQSLYDPEKLAAQYPPDKYPAQHPDPLGQICPFAAHARKMNPRDSSTDQGPNEVTTRHRIMRRASNYGKRPLLGEKDEDEDDRGLLFFCYQTDLQDQFEFLQNQWANRTDPPTPGGHDLIIGQNIIPNQKRLREFQVYIPSKQAYDTWTDIPQFVVTTGSGYFFTPSIKALREQFVGINIKK